MEEKGGKQNWVKGDIESYQRPDKASPNLARSPGTNMNYQSCPELDQNACALIPSTDQSFHVGNPKEGWPWISVAVANPEGTYSSSS